MEGALVTSAGLIERERPRKRGDKNAGAFLFPLNMPSAAGARRQKIGRGEKEEMEVFLGLATQVSFYLFLKKHMDTHYLHAIHKS